MVKPGKKPSVELPRFFKIMMGDFTKKMRIPPAFIKNFGEIIIDEPTLKCHNSKIWPVKVKRECGNVFFEIGWHDFVKDNSLQIGELLVFRYDGLSGFDVHIFGRSGCEKLSITTGSELHEKKRKRLRFTNVCPCKYKVQSGVSARKRGAKTKMVFDAASCPFKLKHPHFTARWRSNKPYTVLIPQVFARQFDLIKRQTRLFRDPGGKLWPVNVVHSCNRSDFGAGWHDFKVWNNLRAKDKCIFELMEDGMIQPIPKDFTTDKGLRNIRSMFFRDPTGKLWPVKLCHSVFRSDFGAGWHDLAIENILCDGDTCILEFVQDNLVQVHIIRPKV